MADQEYRSVMRISYWNEEGREQWLAFPLGESSTPDRVLAEIADRLPSIWFGWRVESEVARRIAQ